MVATLLVAAAALGADPYVLVLGIAQDGGAPQAACHGACCAERWQDPAKRLHVASLAIVDPDARQRWLIDATPDFPAQLMMLDERTWRPQAAPGLDGIFLTHAHTGHYTGLIHLGREAVGAAHVPVHAMPRMQRFLESNAPWDQLVRLGNIELRPLEAGKPVALNDRITVTPIMVPHRDEYSETVGYRIRGPGRGRGVLYVPDIDAWERWDRSVEEELAGVDAALLDGTFFDGAELPGRDLSVIPHPFITRTLERLSALPAAERAKVRFIHLNHTNPALRADSAERKAIEDAGMGVSFENLRFEI